MTKERSARDNAIQWIMGFVIAVLSGILLHHYSKNDNVKAENRKLQNELRQRRENDSIRKENDSLNVVKLKKYLDGLIYNSKKALAARLFTQAKELANQVKWTFNDSVELKIEYEKKRNSLINVIDKSRSENRIVIDTTNNHIYSFFNIDNSIQFTLKEKGGEQVEPNTLFSFFCAYASDERQSAKIVIQFTNTQENQQIEFNGQGATFEFNYDNVRYRITLLKVEDGGDIDFPTFKIKALL